MCESLHYQKVSLQNQIDDINQEIKRFHDMVNLTLKSDGVHIFNSERFRGQGLTTCVADFCLDNDLPIVVNYDTQKKLLCDKYHFSHSQVLTVAEINNTLLGKEIKKVVLDYVDMHDPVLSKLDDLGIQYIGFLRNYSYN